MHAKSVRIAGFLQNFRRLAVCGAARVLAADESRDIQRAIAKEANCEGGAQCRANMMRNVILLISKALFVLIIIIAASIAPRPAHADNVASSVIGFITCIDWRFNPLVTAMLDQADQERTEENKVGFSLIYDYMRGGRCYSGAEKQREWLEYLSEDYGWPEATYALAITYGYGDFDFPVVEFTNSQGYYAYQLKENLGDGEGLDIEAAFSLLEKAAEEGMPVAQVHLAHAYRTGEFGKDGSHKIQQDPEQSMAWLEKLISDKENLEKWEFNSGDMDINVKLELGYRYRYGEKFDIAPDLERAFGLFAEVAQDKSYIFPEATAELALMCADEIIVSEICSVDLYGQIQAELDQLSKEDRDEFVEIYQGKIPHEIHIEGVIAR